MAIQWKTYFAQKGRMDIVKAIEKKYYTAHKEEILAKRKAFYQKNREVLKEKARVRIAEKRRLAKLSIPESV